MDHYECLIRCAVLMVFNCSIYCVDLDLSFNELEHGSLLELDKMFSIVI